MKFTDCFDYFLQENKDDETENVTDVFVWGFTARPKTKKQSSLNLNVHKPLPFIFTVLMSHLIFSPRTLFPFWVHISSSAQFMLNVNWGRIVATCL